MSDRMKHEIKRVRIYARQSVSFDDYARTEGLFGSFWNHPEMLQEIRVAYDRAANL
jgi:hypothetical protein